MGTKKTEAAVSPIGQLTVIVAEISRWSVPQIKTDADVKKVGEAILKIDQAVANITQAFEPTKKEKYAEWKREVADENALLDPAKAKRKEMKDAVDAFIRAQAAERRKKEDEARKLHEAEEKRLRDEAEKAENRGHNHKAAALQEKLTEHQSQPVATYEPPKTQTVGGGSVNVKTVIEVEVSDPLAFLGAIVDRKIPLGVLSSKYVDQTALKQFVRLSKDGDKLPEFPGLKIQEVEASSFSRAH